MDSETGKIIPIAAKIISVMREVEAIKKDRENKMQGYSFRGIDDVYNALHDSMAKNGIFCIPRVLSERTEDRETSKGTYLIYRVLSIEYDMMDETGNKITIGPVIGEGMDTGDKASNKAMAVAHKYALLQAFMIPTNDAKDPEDDSHEPSKPTQSRSQEPGAITIVSVHRNQHEKGPWWKITFSDNQSASTWSESLGTLAEDLYKRGSHCRYTTIVKGKFTNLNTLEGAA